MDGKTVFNNSNAKRRTHEEFLTMADESYHTGFSELLRIPKFDIVKDVPLDGMHLLYQGVTKTLIQAWTTGKSPARQGRSTIKIISDNLQIAKNHCPKDFQRKPREIERVGLWKATEFRSFLLYTAPVSFR